MVIIMYFNNYYTTINCGDKRIRLHDCVGGGILFYVDTMLVYVSKLTCKLRSSSWKDWDTLLQMVALSHVHKNEIRNFVISDYYHCTQRVHHDVTMPLKQQLNQEYSLSVRESGGKKGVCTWTRLLQNNIRTVFLHQKQNYAWRIVMQSNRPQRNMVEHH